MPGYLWNAQICPDTAANDRHSIRTTTSAFATIQRHWVNPETDNLNRPIRQHKPRADRRGLARLVEGRLSVPGIGALTKPRPADSKAKVRMQPAAVDHPKINSGQISMKPTISLLAALLVASSGVFAQDSGDTSAPVAGSGLPLLLDRIPDGTPPPAPPPSKIVPFIPDPATLLETKANQQGGRTITYQRIAAPDLPPSPEPATQPTAEERTAFAARIAELRKNSPKRDFLLLGATAYFLVISPASADPQIDYLDLNTNGYSDIWEMHYSNGVLYQSTIANSDADGDGWTFVEEAAIGTNPSDRSSPDGKLEPTFRIAPPVYSFDENGVEILVTHESFVLTWTGQFGKVYTLAHSPDLLVWSDIGPSLICDDTEMEGGCSTAAAAGFLRIRVSDIDEDGDNLSNWEEHVKGTKLLLRCKLLDLAAKARRRPLAPYGHHFRSRQSVYVF